MYAKYICGDPRLPKIDFLLSPFGSSITEAVMMSLQDLLHRSDVGEKAAAIEAGLLEAVVQVMRVHPLPTDLGLQAQCSLTMGVSLAGADEVLQRRAVEAGIVGAVVAALQVGTAALQACFSDEMQADMREMQECGQLALSRSGCGILAALVCGTAGGGGNKALTCARRLAEDARAARLRAEAPEASAAAEAPAAAAETAASDTERVCPPATSTFPLASCCAARDASLDLSSNLLL